MKREDVLSADEFAEMVDRRATSVLLGRLRMVDRRARWADSLHLFDESGSSLKLTSEEGPLEGRPQVIAAHIADHRAVAGLLISESQTRVTEQRNFPAYRVLSVVGMWPRESLTETRAWQLRFGRRGWELQQLLSGAGEQHCVWLWRLLPN